MICLYIIFVLLAFIVPDGLTFILTSMKSLRRPSHSVLWRSSPLQMSLNEFREYMANSDVNFLELSDKKENIGKVSIKVVTVIILCQIISLIRKVIKTSLAKA